MTRRIANPFAAFCGVLLLTLGLATRANAAGEVPLFPDKTIAKGKGFEIKQSQLDEAFTTFRANQAAQGRPVPEAKRKSIEDNLLNQMIANELVLLKASSADRSRARKASQDYIDQEKKRVGDPVAFKRAVEALGMTMEKFEEAIHRRAVIDAVIERVITPTISIKDSDARKFFDENPKNFERPEMVHAAHILISTVDMTARPPTPLPAAEVTKREGVAKSLVERARKGEDFARLAREFSEDPGSKNKGGEYTFPRGQMVPEFERTAFSLQPGKVSDVVKTQYGFHIIKLLKKIPATKTPFSEVSSRIKEGLLQREIDKALPAYFEKIRAEGNVELMRK